MAHIPKSIEDRCRLIPGLEIRNRGKVRDSYNLPNHPEHMGVVATERCSIFDFVLPFKVEKKGEVLTAMSHFWQSHVAGICPTDFVAVGGGIVDYLPEALREDIDLQKQMTIVKILNPPETEDIVRLYLTGSGWTSYQENQQVCGHRLPAGLKDGNRLPYPLFTPSTKSAEGHDEHLSADDVAKKYGAQHERLALQLTAVMSAHAMSRGIILADTKFEFSADKDGSLTLIDEKGTPDSSRFWDAKAWEKAQAKGGLPPSFDKQYVREWGKRMDVEKDKAGRKRNPQNAEDLAYIAGLPVTSDVVVNTIYLYRYIFWRLTGKMLERYQIEKMGIAGVDVPRRRIEIIVGSRSDLDEVKPGFEAIKDSGDVHVNVISCHRNSEELRQFLTNQGSRANVIIAAAGMAAQLAGVSKGILCSLKRTDIPVIGVALEGKSPEQNQAAISSMEQLPEQPVELDLHGKAYFGKQGCIAACLAAVEHEFLPKGFTPKPAEYDIYDK